VINKPRECVPFTDADILSGGETCPSECGTCLPVYLCSAGLVGGLPVPGPHVCFSGGKNGPGMECPQIAYPQ
jgi:hypothetical protein